MLGEAEKEMVSTCRPSGTKKQLLIVMQRLKCPVGSVVGKMQTAQEVFPNKLVKITPQL